MLATGRIPLEVPFDDDGGTNPRNNTSVVTWLALGTYRALLTGDAGVPALDQAWDFLEATSDASPPTLAQVPHAGSRHNASSALLNRILGPPGQVADGSKEAQVSVASRSVRHPSARVANAYMRRGYRVFETRGKTVHYASPDAPVRHGWVPAVPLEPLDEGLEEAA
jgi:beta-lactamase superfamily II metal-dependent hydrolase